MDIIMKKTLLIVCTICAAVFAWAEVSPIPEAQFNFIYNQEEHPLIATQGSELFVCENRLCAGSEPLGVYGAQEFSCGPGSCQVTAYEFSPFARLVISFEDGVTRASNIFAFPQTLVAKFNVYVNADKLVVEPVDTPPYELLWTRPEMWGSLILILMLELACAAAFIFYQQKRFRILYGVAIANVVTTGVVWLFLMHYLSQSALLWLFCVLSEAGLIALINRKDITLKEAGILSIMMNVTSYTLGMILSFVWAQF